MSCIAFDSGTQLTLSLLRAKFWIIHARQLVKSVISKCSICIRHRGQTASQLIGNLPSARVNSSDIFSHIGIDFAGPVKVRTSPGRGYKSINGYICVFICLATKAVHLEVVSGNPVPRYGSSIIFRSARNFCLLVASF